MHSSLRSLPFLLGGLLAAAEPAAAQMVSTAGTGFQINRYEPTAAGEWSFWVNHPYYSSTRYFAAGLTLNYAHNPLVFGVLRTDGTFSNQQAVISHQFIGHVDLAGSFLDRVLLSLSLPIVFVEKGGTPTSSIAAAEKVSVGDLRLGGMVRLWGQPYRSPFSMSIGADLWIPFRKFSPDGLPPTSSDTEVRGTSKLVLGGLADKLMWSFTAGVLLRRHANLGDPALGAEANSELQIGAALAYANTNLRLAVGPEVMVATAISGSNAFKTGTSNVEALLGVHYNIANLVQVGVGGGVGILRQVGTPDGRFLLRVAYAPMAKPARDRDKDGVLDVTDRCPDVPRGPQPDPSRPGCPLLDRDQDGIADDQDLCPSEAQGQNPDPARRGCPLLDRDSDGIPDREDLCPDASFGKQPDPTRRGCPAGDRDSDGVLDHEDLCPDVHKSQVPDAQKQGCPAPDRDKDTIQDPVDACPEKPGAPSADRTKNGCPGLVSFSNGQIVTVKPVYFATGKDIILRKSYNILESVANSLQAANQIKKLRVEGHTDDRGKIDFNTDLSDRRAKSVMKWLVEHGIAQDRLEAKGYGPAHPITDNKSSHGRAKNRRVDFVILDAEQAANQQPGQAAALEVSTPPAADPHPTAKRAHHHRRHVARPHHSRAKSR